MVNSSLVVWVLGNARIHGTFLSTKVIVIPGNTAITDLMTKRCLGVILV
jgi:hypothetical protein